MRNLLTPAAVLACGLGVATLAYADSASDPDRDSDEAFTLRFTATHPTDVKQGSVPPASHPIRRTALTRAIRVNSRQHPRSSTRSTPIGRCASCCTPATSTRAATTARSATTARFRICGNGSEIRSSIRPATTNGRIATSRVKAEMSWTRTVTTSTTPTEILQRILRWFARCSSRRPAKRSVRGRCR